MATDTNYAMPAHTVRLIYLREKFNSDAFSRKDSKRISPSTASSQPGIHSRAVVGISILSLVCSEFPVVRDQCWILFILENLFCFHVHLELHACKPAYESMCRPSLQQEGAHICLIAKVSQEQSHPHEPSLQTQGKETFSTSSAPHAHKSAVLSWNGHHFHGARFISAINWC